MTLLPEVETALVDAVRRHQHLPASTSPSRQQPRSDRLPRGGAKPARAEHPTSSELGIGRLRARKLVIGLSAALPVLIVAALFLLETRAPHMVGHATTAEAGKRTTLRQAFPVLRQPRRPSDLLPPGWNSPRVHLDRQLGRLVFTNGARRMWLVPAKPREICLLGTGGLGAGCTTDASAEQRGLLSLITTSTGATQVQGILPHGATLTAHYADHTPSGIPTNPDQAFVLRLQQPATSFTLTTPSSKTVSIPGKCMTRKHKRPARHH